MKEQLFKELEVSDFFGHLKEEKKDYEIKEFVCAGSKQYGLKVEFI